MFMVFINPKIDFAFKKIFGSEDSKDILISFLNALIYDEQPIIQDLEILNPYIAPKIRGVKDTYSTCWSNPLQEGSQGEAPQLVLYSYLWQVWKQIAVKEKDFLIDYPIYDIELIFIELPKFKKQLSDLKTIVDNNLESLKNSLKWSKFGIPKTRSTF